MNINLKNNFVLKTDKNQFKLQKKNIAQTGKNEGQEVFETIGYYANLDDALQGVLDKKILSSDVTLWQELLKEIIEIKEEIQGIRQILTV